MTDFNLPAAYAELVAKRPELAVDVLQHRPHPTYAGWVERIYKSEDGKTSQSNAISERAAAGHITAKLLAELPNNRGLHHGDRGWSISRCDDDGRWNCECIEDTPLRALLAFHLKGTP